MMKSALQSVLVVRPESVSYERSRGIRRWVFREVSARAFFDSPKNPKMSNVSNFGEKSDFSRKNTKKLKSVAKAILGMDPKTQNQAVLQCIAATEDPESADA